MQDPSLCVVRNKCGLSECDMFNSLLFCGKKISTKEKTQNTMFGKLILFFIIFGLVRDSTAVKITSLQVPKSAWSSVKLNCRYDLEGESLYGVKWYKDGIEFFRCLSDGSVQEFPISDAKIYHTDSAQPGSCFFELTALTHRSGGVYMCEVSLDWPTFQTVTKSATLQIVEPTTTLIQTHARTERMPKDDANTEKSQAVYYPELSAWASCSKTECNVKLYFTIIGFVIYYILQ